MAGLKLTIKMLKIDPKMSKMAHEKNRRFVIFRTPFFTFLTKIWPIRIYRKTGPTKSTVLGPRPPPWRKHKFYRFLSNFDDFGAFNRAGKTVSKIGIYALPPLKSEFYEFLLKIGGQNLLLYHFFKNYFILNWFNNSLPRHWNCFTLVLLVWVLYWLWCSFSVVSVSGGFDSD
jgi:hypothetical protein